MKLGLFWTGLGIQIVQLAAILFAVLLYYKIDFFSWVPYVAIGFVVLVANMISLICIFKGLGHD